MGTHSHRRGKGFHGELYASLSWIERKKTGGRKNKIGAEKAENQASSQKNVEKLPTPEELEKLRQSANK